MKEPEEYTGLFIRKIKNLTTPEENERINNLLAEDPDLEKEFEELRVLTEAVKLYEYQKEAEAYFSRPKRVLRLSGIFTKAAVFLLFTGGSLLTYLTFSDNYLPGINADAGVVRSTNGTYRSVPGPVSSQEAAFEKFVMGQAYFSSGDFPKAIELFEEAIKTPDLRNQVREALQWHLCVAYLSDGQVKRADYWMDEIEKNDEPRYKISWLNKLKVKWQILIKGLFS